MVRMDISNAMFNRIRKKKMEIIQQKKRDRRFRVSRVTDAYALDMLFKENGKY